MIRKFIANIRRKPRALREGIAFWIAVSVTGIVVFVWVYHMPTRFEGVSLNVGDSEASKQAASMFEEFQEQLSASRSTLPDESDDSAEGQVLQEMVEEYRQQNQRNSVASTSTNTATSTATSSSQQNASVNSGASSETQPQPIGIITTSQAGTSSSQSEE